MIIRRKEISVILSILLALSHGQLQLLPVLIASEVIQWSVTFVEVVSTGYQFIASFNDDSHDTSQTDERIDALASVISRGMTEISYQLKEISDNIQKRVIELRKLITKLRLQINIDNRMHDLVTKMSAIDSIYDTLLKYIKKKKKSKHNGRKLCTFALRHLISKPLTERVDAMYNVIIPSQQLEAPFLYQIYQEFEDDRNGLCGTQRSTVDYLHGIYTSLMLVEIKAFMMSVFFHNLLYRSQGIVKACHYPYQNPNGEIKMAQRKFRDHLRAYSREFLIYMKKASREFRSCDREGEFIRDGTYYELEGAIQTIIQPIPNIGGAIMNPYSRMSCEDIRESYGTPAVYCDYRRQICTTSLRQSCRGYTRGCRSSSDWIHGCIATNSSRRYEWIQWEDNHNNDTYKLENCEQPLKIQKGVTSNVIEYLNAVHTGSSDYKGCLCECNDNDVNSRSTHTFNLQWVESDVSNNMIITGIRFIVEHRVMQLQIQQGKLGQNFKVTDVAWKPINDISEEIRAARLHKKIYGELPKVVENVDYLIVNKGINNAINLDTLSLSFPNVLTGVRFYLSREESGAERIQIAIKGVKYDHIHGKLAENFEPEIVTSTISHKQRYHYPRKNVKNPIFPTLPITPPGQYVDIDVSDLIHDFGQTTLPYFDALPLVSKPPSPLGGLGIFLKGAGDFTGFVSLKFVSMDHATYIKNSLHEIQQQKKLHEIEPEESPVKTSKHKHFSRTH